MENIEENKLAQYASQKLPTIEDIREKNPKADGYFVVQYDGGGEYVLWFFDYNGSVSGHYGEPVQRHIKMFTAPPSADVARDIAVQWLETNAYWL